MLDKNTNKEPQEEELKEKELNAYLTNRSRQQMFE